MHGRCHANELKMVASTSALHSSNQPGLEPSPSQFVFHASRSSRSVRTSNFLSRLALAHPTASKPGSTLRGHRLATCFFAGIPNQVRLGNPMSHRTLRLDDLRLRSSARRAAGLAVLFPAPLCSKACESSFTRARDCFLRQRFSLPLPRTTSLSGRCRTECRRWAVSACNSSGWNN